MLTEKEAWSVLAGLWSNPKFDENGSCFVRPVKDSPSYGLCNCINDLVTLGHISEGVARVMTDRLYEFRQTSPRRSYAFLWPNDADGARHRALFCAAQAENL